MRAYYNYLFIIFFVSLFVSCKKGTLFTQLPSSHTNIHFINEIVENDSINPLDLTNVYNGGGVGIGDFNNDGLQDVYFTGNLVSNKLYLNNRNLVFKDITTEAGVAGDGKWCKGVSVVDINNDGWMDMYVCASIYKDPARRQNLLYVNNGVDKNGIPHFIEMAKEYGLNDTTHSTMANFFDYDNDGDLDVYIVVNEIVNTNNPSVFRPIIKDGSFFSTGRLYRNDWNASLKHPVFTNVSMQAGITFEGYGHAATIADINKDGWKDIFVSNDFLSNDILYINNHDGTFTNKVRDYFKHTSANGMGQDITDINNDGLADIIELDMNPKDNYRKKMMLGNNNYQTYQNSDYYGYQYQYVRNTLQLNQGPGVNSNDSIGEPVFSEIAFFSGMAETDWSWAPLVADFDNDAYRDIIITNGYPKDVTDHDFVAFRQQAYAIASKKYTLGQIPQVKIKNYAFHNNHDLTFSNLTFQWGIEQPSFSNGAAYADLDNDGDLDYAVNNINDEAFVYENHARDNKAGNHYIQIKFSSEAPNINALGAWVELNYDKGKQQVFENTPYRGYLSTVQQGAHFGLDTISVVDSIIIKWPDGKMQTLKNVKADQVLTVKHSSANK
ncbi:MAG: CRTAC1 family protein, partial [Parafilimonas sp.]